MSVLNFLKSGAAKAIPPDESRCRHHYANRSRCTKSIAEGSEFFCRHHIDTGQLANSVLTSEEREADLIALRAEIMGHFTALDSAEAVNHVLSNLFCVYLEGRISQTKIAQLTSVCRSLLSSIRLKRDEQAAKAFEKCFIDLPSAAVSSDPSKLKDKSEPVRSGVAPTPARTETAEGSRKCAAVLTEPSNLEDNSQSGHGAHVAPHSSAAVSTASDNTAAANSTDARNHEQFSPDSSPAENSQESAPPTSPNDFTQEVESGPTPDQITLEPAPIPPSPFGHPALRRKRRR